jgi:glycosyltransferase involved in cell wall biosynthesis
MKIVFTTDTINRGGKERQLFILARYLTDKGVPVRIIAKNFSKENYLYEYGLNPEIIKYYNGDSFFKKLKSFKRLVADEKPDLLISWDIQTSLFALWLWRKGFIFINASIQHGIRLIKVSHLIRTVLCHLAPYVIANSYAGLRCNNLKPGQRRFTLYNGTGNKFINTLTKEEVELRRKKEIPGYSESPGIVYVTVANMVPYKDYFTVFKALKKLKGVSSFHYVIIGNGPMHEKIEEEIKKLRLEKQVYLTGEIENVKDYLFLSDIMIHSSRGEGISNAILEGMFAGLPVIATNVGGIPETVFPKSSLLFSYKDHETLYQCLLKSPELKTSFDPESEEYQDHLKKFSVDTMVNKFEEILKDVISKR